MFLFIASFIISFISIYIIYKFNFGLDKSISEKLHAIHSYSVSRMGGLGIVISLVILSIFFNKDFLLVLIAGVAIFVFGYIEDKYQVDFSYKEKIFFLSLSAIILIYLTKIGVFNFGFFYLDKENYLMLNIAYFIAFIGIVGMSSAINFIDGLNGYATGVVFITLCFFALYSYKNDMIEIFQLILIINGALFGFLILNFPFGKIFLGDMGAHLIGFIVAYISIVMTNNSKVSSWYPLAAFTIPIIETLNTIYRRIKRQKKGISFNKSDLDHLHHYVWNVIKDKYLFIQNDKIKNSIATIYILVFHCIINIIAFYFKNNDIALIIIFVLSLLIYLKVYNQLKLKILR